MYIVFVEGDVTIHHMRYGHREICTVTLYEQAWYITLFMEAQIQLSLQLPLQKLLLSLVQMQLIVF